MRRRKLFTFEQEQEIYREYLSGEYQCALATKFGVSQSVISRLIKKHSLVDSEFSHPFDAASSFPAYSGNDQASFTPHVFQVSNDMHPGMHFLPVPLAQEGEATSAGTFKRPSGTATSVPAHVVHGHPPNVYPNGIPSNTHFVHLAQEGRVAVPARHWPSHAAIHAPSPTIHTVSVEEGSEIYKRCLNGENECAIVLTVKKNVLSSGTFISSYSITVC